MYVIIHISEYIRAQNTIILLLFIPPIKVKGLKLDLLMYQLKCPLVASCHYCMCSLNSDNFCIYRWSNGIVVNCINVHHFNHHYRFADNPIWFRNIFLGKKGSLHKPKKVYPLFKAPLIQPSTCKQCQFIPSRFTLFCFSVSCGMSFAL